MSGTILEVSLVDERGAPVAAAGVAIDLILFVRGNRRYQFDVGDTDASGALMTSLEALEGLRREEQRFALMDYNTELRECDPVLAVHIPTTEELQARLGAPRKWFPERAPKLEKRLLVSRNADIQGDDQMFQVATDARNAMSVTCRRQP